jgi:hypothetical protein
MIETRNCLDGLETNDNCELLVSSRRIICNWMAGNPMALPMVRKAWYVLLGSEEIPWIDSYEIWIQTQKWTQIPHEVNDAFWGRAESESERMERMYAQYVLERQDRVDVNLREWGWERDQTVSIERIALLEAQQGVEELFALHARDTLYGVFLARLRMEQWRIWNSVLMTIQPFQLAPMKAVIYAVSKQLGIDSTQVQETWNKVRSPALQDSVHRYLQEDWSRVWPLKCDLRYGDADPQELLRILGEGGALDVWKKEQQIDSQYLQPVLEWRRSMLLDAVSWRPRDVRFVFCAVPHWDLTLRIDSLIWNIPSGSDSCTSGSITWPKLGSYVEINAKHGRDRMQWKGRGQFSLPRLFNEFGTWKNGQGLRVQIPLHTKSFSSQWIIQWQETGPDPRLIKPCGMALTRRENGNELSK